MTEEYNPIELTLLSMIRAIKALRDTVPSTVSDITLQNALLVGDYEIKPGRIEQVPEVLAVWESDGLVFYVK
jgi:hypothetical protein